MFNRNNFLPQIFYIDVANRVSTLRDTLEDMYLFNALYKEYVWIVIKNDNLLISKKNLSFNSALKEAYIEMENDVFAHSVKIVISSAVIDTVTFYNKLEKNFNKMFTMYNDKRFLTQTKINMLVTLLDKVYFDNTANAYGSVYNKMGQLLPEEFIKAMININLNKCVEVYASKNYNEPVFYINNTCITYIMDNKYPPIRSKTNVKIYLKQGNLCVKYKTLYINVLDLKIFN